VEITSKNVEDIRRAEILRLCCRSLWLTATSLRMTRDRMTKDLRVPLGMTGIRVAIVLVGLLGGISQATTYYVSSSSGSDVNNGTSSSTAWQTIGHVNAQTFQPGDSVLFKRGDVWNESLAPPSSGASGNPISFDAYGAGAPPNFTGYYAMPPTEWIAVSGNAWKAQLPSTYATVNFCLFGPIWGQKVPALSSNLTAPWDFYIANGYLYVFAVGNGLSLRFYLSQTPFAQTKPALIDEEYLGPGLDPTTWVVSDPNSAVSVVAQTLQVNGGTGLDGQTAVVFIEQVELGGAIELQHGDVSFNAASQGVIGGLYAGAVAVANCVAGFQVMPNGTGSNLQALINGSATGPVVATTAGHRYVLTTYLYSMEVYRAQETYHSSAHPAGSGWGGAAVPADVRFVLELQDIDPANQATMAAPATVLFDGVIENAPGFCTYALVDAASMQCNIAYTYAAHISLAEVRTALPNASYVTQLVGSVSSGAECEISSSTTLDFFPAYVPSLNTLIVVSYRGFGRAAAEVVNAVSAASLASGADNGARGWMRMMETPSARTQADCENAALAILDDGVSTAWSGTYETWSDFLPGAATDVFPGDAIAVNIPSRGAVFNAIVRKVTINVVDPTDDRGMYTIEFSNDLAQPLAYQDVANTATISLEDMPPRLATTQIGACYLANLIDAQITQVSATTVSIDAGMAPTAGGGIEVRLHDYGWGVANDRNLLGRFSTQTFTLPRLASTQNYFLRLYDSSSPPLYSRYSAALYVNYPL
jgi:hypothetical protein